MIHKTTILIYLIFSTILTAQKIETGNASFYADKFDGRTTASGATFRQDKLTAAHRTLDFGTKVRVTNLENNKSIEVVVNDRGPFVNDRIIDLSKKAATELDFIKKGVAMVKIEVLENLKNEINEQNTTSKDFLYKKVSENITNKNYNLNYYKIDTKKVSPTGFGVQVASYIESTNLIQHCEEIKNKTKQDLLVQINQINGKKIYRVIVGTFSTREKADDFKKKMQNKFTGSFVVSF